MPEDFTPDELKILIDNGELTEDDISYLSTRNRLTAGTMLLDAGKMEAKGGMPLPGPGALGAAAGAAGKVASKLPSPPSGVGGIAAQMGIDFIGQKLGLPWWMTGVLSHKAGKMAGPKAAPRATAPPKAPKAAPAPKPWGQRSAPVAGSKPLGPQPQAGPAPKTTTRPPSGPSGPPNLHRQGNLTRPGPKGPGSPSTPSGKVENPLDRVGDSLKGPAGNDANYQRVGPERRSSGPSAPPDGISERRYEELLGKFGGKPGGKQSPLSSFDEADRRKVVMGGPSGQFGGTYRPTDRGKALTKAQIDDLIKNILSIAKQ